MDRNTVVSLLMVGPPPLPYRKRRRRRSTESTDSDDESSETCLQISEQRRRLQAIQLADRDTLHFCVECQLLFKNPSQLLAHHVYRHFFESSERGRKLPCPFCQQRCRSRSTMAAHLGTHIGERACDKCGAEFATSEGATAHERFHRTGGDFSCEICEIAFQRQSSLSAHIRTLHAPL